MEQVVDGGLLLLLLLLLWLVEFWIMPTQMLGSGG